MFFDNNTAESSTSPPQTPQSSLPRSKTFLTKAATAVSPLPEPSTQAAPSTHLAPPTAPTKPLTPPASTDESDYEDVPTLQHLTSQSLSNTTFLYPLSTPVLLTSRDPSTNTARTLILSTNPRTILFSATGTSLSAYESLLHQTEIAVHARLADLNPSVEELRSAVDSARLQRENQAMLEALERKRGEQFALAMPPTTTRRKSLLLPAQHKAHLHTHRPALPKSHRFTRKTELALPARDAAEMVSPRTIPTGKPRGLRPPQNAQSRLGERWGDEAESVAAWIREVEEAELTPPLTPGAAGQGLPKSRRFEEGRAAEEGRV